MPEARFHTTQWSLVLAAGEPDSPRAEEALADLCARYWHPVFAFIRREGYTTDEAQDLTQGFFTRLIEKRDLGDADRTRGRFRTFLLAACRHFLSNERDRAQALKRGGGQVAVSIDDAMGKTTDETPEQVYERQWALSLLAGVLEDLRAKYDPRVFDRLRGFLTADDSDGYASAALDLGMSLAAVKVAIHRLRKRYREGLRLRIADTVASDADVDDELRHLFRVTRNE